MITCGVGGCSIPTTRAEAVRSANRKEKENIHILRTVYFRLEHPAFGEVFATVGKASVRESIDHTRTIFDRVKLECSGAYVSPLVRQNGQPAL